MKNAMKERGIEIARMNYQENGNWAYQVGQKPDFHIHLYGRTKNSISQKWSGALYFPNKSTGFYDLFDSWNKKDIEEMKKQVKKLEQNEKYLLKSWGLE